MGRIVSPMWTKEGPAVVGNSMVEKAIKNMKTGGGGTLGPLKNYCWGCLKYLIEQDNLATHIVNKVIHEDGITVSCYKGKRDAQDKK